MEFTSYVKSKKHPIIVIAAMLILVGGMYMWNESDSQNVVTVGDEQVAQVSYTPLQPLPGQESVDTTDTVGYLQRILFLGIGLAFVLAVLMIVIGGVQYMASDAFTSKEDAKQKITMALLGLLIALGGYLLLNTINPDLVTFKFSPETRNIGTTKSSETRITRISVESELGHKQEGGTRTQLSKGGFALDTAGASTADVRNKSIKAATLDCQNLGSDFKFEQKCAINVPLTDTCAVRSSVYTCEKK